MSHMTRPSGCSDKGNMQHIALQEENCRDAVTGSLGVRSETATNSWRKRWRKIWLPNSWLIQWKLARYRQAPGEDPRFGRRDEWYGICVSRFYVNESQSSEKTLGVVLLLHSWLDRPAAHKLIVFSGLSLEQIHPPETNTGLTLPLICLSCISLVLHGTTLFC